MTNDQWPTYNFQMRSLTMQNLLYGLKRSIKITVHFKCTSANVIYCITRTYSVGYGGPLLHRRHSICFLNSILSRSKWKIIAREMGICWVAQDRLSCTLFLWLQQLRRYALRSVVRFIFVKRSLSSTLQYFHYTALWINSVNLDFAKSYETLSEMAVSRVSQNKCGLSNLSDYSAGLKISRCHFCVANPVKKELSNCCSHCRLVHGNNVSDSRSRATWQVSHLSRDNLSFIPHFSWRDNLSFIPHFSSRCKWGNWI